MAGAAALQAASVDPASGFKAHWLASCMTHNPGWQEVVWDEAAVLQLVTQHFPWFLPAYRSYPKLVQRSDVARYMVLYKYGGVYLDADVECYAGLEASLLGKDLVLNCEYPGDWGQLHNAAMAATPGHPFWLQVLQEAARRSPAGYVAGAGPAGALSGARAGAARASSGSGGISRSAMLRLRQLWERTPFHNSINAVLRSTGPMLLTDVYQAYIGGMPACGHSWLVDGRVSTAYPLGTWFTPCLYHDKHCLMLWTTQHFMLTAAQEQQGAGAPFSTPLHEQELRRQQRQQQQQQQRRRRQQQAQELRVQPPLTLQQQQQEQQPVIGIHHYSGSWTGWSHDSKEQQQLELSRQASQHVLEYFRDSPAFLQHRCSSAGHLPSTLAGSLSPHCIEELMLQQPGAQPSACAMLSVLAPAAQDEPLAPAAAAVHAGAGVASERRLHSDATQEGTGMVLEEQMRQQLGCDLLLVTPGEQQGDQRSLQGQPSQLAAAASHDSMTASSSDDTGSDSSGHHAGRIRQVQGLLQAAVSDEECASRGCLTLQGMLQELQHGSQHRQLASSSALHGPDTLPARHIVRLSCDRCEVPVLRQLARLTAADSSAALEAVAVLVLDLQVLQEPAPGSPAGTTTNGSAAARHSNSSSSSNVVVEGLDEVYNLLHQQLGFKGFSRQQLSPTTLRLGWVRALGSRQPLPPLLPPADAVDAGVGSGAAAATSMHAGGVAAAAGGTAVA